MTFKFFLYSPFPLQTLTYNLRSFLCILRADAFLKVSCPHLQLVELILKYCYLTILVSRVVEFELQFSQQRSGAFVQTTSGGSKFGD